MKRILYASGSILTGDDIAESVVRYATILARSNSADMISIPVVTSQGLSIVQMLIGHATPLAVEDANIPHTSVDDGSALAALDKLCDERENPTPVRAQVVPREDFGDL